MIIGVPKEIKTNENRVALVPAGAEAFVTRGHEVYMEQGAGMGSGFPDQAYLAAGARILPAMPAFYQQPKTIDDLASFLAGKILNALGFEQQLFAPWTGE